ncbi:unnamed protein product, partial [Tilletia controversa]
MDFANPLIRPKMNLLPSRDDEFGELKDGTEFAFQRDTRRTPPMVQRDDGFIIWTDEVVSMSNGRLVRPFNFFHGPNAVILSEGWEVTKRGITLVTSTTPISFDINDVNSEASELLRKKSVVDNNGNESSSSNRYREMAVGRLVIQVPVILFVDETSGTTTKRWNEHIVLYMSNGALPRKDMDRSANVKLLSTSADVGAEAVLSVAVQEFIRLQECPFTTFDVVLDKEVLVRPILALIVADNPMAAILCGSIGMRGLFACRECRAGGTKKEMKKASGFKKLLKIGTKKTAKIVIASLKKQLSTSIKTGVLARLTEQQRSSGIKDALANQYCLEHISLFKATPRADQDTVLSGRMTRIQAGKWHTSLLLLQ